MLEPVLERRRVRAVDRLLRESLRDGRLPRDLPGHPLRLLEPRLLRDDARDEPGALRLVRVEEAAGEDHVHRLRLADRAREPLRPARARDDPEPRLRLAEPRRLGRDDQVAAHRELVPAAETKAGDGTDERRPEPADRIPALHPPRIEHVHCGRVRQLADVRAGRERPLVAGEDDAANRLVAVQLLEPCDELLHERLRERVQLLGPVQPDDRDRVVLLDDDECVLGAHLSFDTNFRTAAWGSSVAIESASQSRAWLIVSCHARSFQKFRCCFA